MSFTSLAGKARYYKDRYFGWEYLAETSPAITWAIFSDHLTFAARPARDRPGTSVTGLHRSLQYHFLKPVLMHTAKGTCDKNTQCFCLGKINLRIK